MVGRHQRSESLLSLRIYLFASALSIGACTGTLGSSENSKSEDPGTSGDGDVGGGGPGSGTDPDKMAPPSCDTSVPYVSSSVLRRMTRHQYNRTALLLFGDNTKPAESFPVETREEGYDNQSSSQHVQQPEVIAWEAAATQLAESAAKNPEALLGCDASVGDECFEAGFPSLMRRVLRTSPGAEEIQHYQDFYASLREEASHELATELVVRALLLSPRFLFIVEEGTDWSDGVGRLNGYEVASRLSFLLWNQAPDSALLDAADSGALDTREGIAIEAERLLRDEKAEDLIRDFHSQWIDLAEIDNMVLPEGADPELKQSAKREIEWFIGDWYTNGSGLISDLFTSRASLVDEHLAALYGITAPSDGAAEVSLPHDERAGLLTRAVFLGTHGIPPTRGDFILSRVLCKPVPPLTFVPPLPPELGESATTRQRFEKHAEDPCASSCHGVLDPVGFAFENYDNAGQWRDTENGTPVDAATELTLSEESGVNGPVSGALELSQKIASSPLAAECLGENWFRYSYGRAAKRADDCSVEALQAPLKDSGDVRELLLSLTQTDAFLYIRKEGL